MQTVEQPSNPPIADIDGQHIGEGEAKPETDAEKASDPWNGDASNTAWGTY